MNIPERLPRETGREFALRALKENITYDETVKTDCGTNDFAAYVLRVGKRGYSVHYAACAAVMLRYFGVPSRYVEGYYINAETADILELVTGEYADLEELVSEKAFKEFINSFKEKVKFKYGKYRINLTELTKNEKFFNWLKKYKIDNKIMSIHNKIVKEMNNIEKEFYIIQ